MLPLPQLRQLDGLLLGIASNETPSAASVLPTTAASRGKESGPLSVQPIVVSIAGSRRGALTAALLGAALLAVAWVAAMPHTISGIEESVFRALNGLPDWIVYPGWPVMQFGSILAVPFVAAACFGLFRDWRLPARMALAGGSAYLVAKYAKVLADRARPDAFFTDIDLRPAWEGLGFPSGHSAIAVALAVVLGAALPRPWRFAVWTAAALTGLLRIYFAAHLPLDVLGGWGLGLAVGALVAPRLPRPDAGEPGLDAALA